MDRTFATVNRWLFPVTVLALAFSCLCCTPVFDVLRHPERLPYRRYRDCLRSQSSFAGAVELYNLDHTTVVRSLTPALRAKLNAPPYRQAGTEPGDDHRDEYVLAGEKLVVFCPRHGCRELVEKAVPPREQLTLLAVSDPALLARASTLPRPTLRGGPDIDLGGVGQLILAGPAILCFLMALRAPPTSGFRALACLVVLLVAGVFAADLTRSVAAR